MTVSLLHTTPADGTFSAQGATAWDAEHALTMAGSGKVLGRTTAGTGAVEELTEITLASGTKTASAPVMDMTQTWNNAAVTFTGFKFNVTDTTSAAASLLMDLQVGGSSVAHFTKNGILRVGNASKSGVIHNQNDVSLRAGTGGDGYGNNILTVTSANLVQMPFGNLSFGGDITLTRRGAANLRLGAADAAAPVAQTLSVQSVVAGTSNTAGANLTITGSQGTGTGAGGSIIFQVAPAGGAGNLQNGLATALTINTTGQVTVSGQGTSNNALIIADTSATNKIVLGVPAGVGNLIYASSIGDAVLRATNSNILFGVNASGELSLGLTTASSIQYAVLPSTGRLVWNNVAANSVSGLSTAGFDVQLARDAANTLALRNGTNAQTFNLYKTYTNASNYQRVALYASAGGNIVLEQQVAGTGVATDFYIGNSSGSSNVIIQTGAGVARWKWDSNGHFLANADNTYDIGASGASRPRNVHVAGTVIPGRGVTVAGLPTPSTGMIARVTDALAPTIGATVTGGGAAYALVNYNGANWTVIGV